MTKDLPIDNMTAEEAQAYFDTHSTSIQIDCDFGGRIAPFPVYVGEPKDDAHPLQHQAHWLQAERGGTIPPDVMESFSTLQKIAKENNVSFQMLCVYAFGEVRANREAQKNQEAAAMQEGAPQYQSGYSPPNTPGYVPPGSRASGTIPATETASDNGLSNEQPYGTPQNDSSNPYSQG